MFAYIYIFSKMLRKLYDYFFSTKNGKRLLNDHPTYDALNLWFLRYNDPGFSTVEWYLWDQLPKHRVYASIASNFSVLG